MTADHRPAALVRVLATGARPAHLLSLRQDTLVAASIDETFAFFADACNLERLTPPWLGFRIATPTPVHMGVGTEIEYRILLHGVPIPWRSRIDVWEPGVRFVDRQLHGPYRWWRHEHRFERTGPGTRVIDEVEYLPRLSWLTTRWVRRDLERIFEYRETALQAWFARGGDGDARRPPPDLRR